MTSLRELTRVRLTSEPDVREEFLAPLIRLLGYDSDAGEVDRHRKLTTPFYSGTKRRLYIVPDYLLLQGSTVGVALDAKSPGDTPADSRAIVLAEAYVAQVYSYAAHSEVQAPFYVTCNGAIAVFRTNSVEIKPELVLDQTELQDRFSELEALIGKQAIASLRQRLPSSLWRAPLNRIDQIGFQPMNFDVGDIDGDGQNEIVVAPSEGSLRIISAHHVTSVDVQSWPWWVRCTHSSERGDAPVVALEKDPAGRILGISRAGVLWERPLRRSGSGHEQLGKIAIIDRRVVAASAVDSIVECVSLQGDHQWTMDLAAELPGVESVQHVLRLAESRIAASVGHNPGYLVMISADGNLLSTRETGWPPGQIVPLPGGCILAHEAGGSAYAIYDAADWRVHSRGSFGASTRLLALSDDGDFLAATSTEDVAIYRVALGGIESTPLIRIPVVNRPWALCWFGKDGQKRLAIGTIGGYPPEASSNGVFIHALDGTLKESFLVRRAANSWSSLGGIRAMSAYDLDSDGREEIIALSDDGFAYVKRPEIDDSVVYRPGVPVPSRRR